MTTKTAPKAADVISPALERAAAAIAHRHIRASSHSFTSVFLVGYTALAEKVAAKAAAKGAR